MELIVRDTLVTGKRDKVYQFHEMEVSSSDQEHDLRENCEIIFVTGSKNKVMELKEKLNYKFVKLTVLNLDLVEIQDIDPLNIAEDKCRRAHKLIEQQLEPLESNCTRYLMVEDTSLHFKAFNGLPGPYIKWFVESMKPDGLFKMISAFEDKSAEAVCTYALMKLDMATKISFLRGSVGGNIVEPRGTSWGWDPIFEEGRTRLTFAEMDRETKSKFSHRANAITILKKFLTTMI